MGRNDRRLPNFWDSVSRKWLIGLFGHKQVLVFNKKVEWFWNCLRGQRDCGGHAYTLILFIFFSFFKILFYFLTLQYCIGFTIYRNESTTGIHVFPILNPPPSPYHPSGSSQHTSPKHPVSCIEPGLVIHFIYDIIHISMPFSLILDF